MALDAPVTERIRVAVPWLGTPHDRAEAATTLLGAGIVTAIYVLIARALDTPTTALEGWSLVFSLACVWLARTENIWNMPLGIAAVVLMGVFYFRVELVGQAWLQFLFYVPVQMVGWWAWSRGGSQRTELPVSRLTARGWMFTLSATGLAWAGCWLVFDAIYDHPSHLAWDTSIVAASVMAQTLMTYKKTENWLFWTLPVNVSSVALYVVTDAWAFAFLYSVFLLHSAWAWWQWQQQRGAAV